MIIDAHAHLDLEEITGEDYIRLMNASGVNKVVLLASLNSLIPPTPDWQISIMRFLLSTPLQPLGKRIYESLIKGDCLKGGGKIIQIVQNPDNYSVSQVVSRYPERFMAFVVINPKLKNAMEVLEKGIEEQGMVGVKCHAWWHRVDISSELLPIARRCEERGLPLLVHLGGGRQTGNFEVLLDNCPRVKQGATAMSPSYNGPANYASRTTIRRKSSTRIWSGYFRDCGSSQCTGAEFYGVPTHSMSVSN
jgi:predicted TIM-barrel fold metal-dependent hydrolase